MEVIRGTESLEVQVSKSSSRKPPTKLCYGVVGSPIDTLDLHGGLTPPPVQAMKSGGLEDCHNFLKQLLAGTPGPADGVG